MQFASLLFATATLVTPGSTQTAATAAASVSDAPTSPPAIQQPYSSSSRSRQRDRGFGLGANLAASTRGLGGAMRYWFGDQLGVNFGASWNRGRDYGSTQTSSSFIVAPSVIYVFTKSDTTKDVDLRPYVGAGVNYARAGQVRTSARQDPQQGATGMQVFGGVELTMADAPNVSISGEVAYFKLPSNFLNSDAIGGTNFLIGVHFYF